MRNLANKAIKKGLQRLKMKEDEKKRMEQRSQRRTDAFIRVQRYTSLVQSGVEPQDAAARAGIHMPVSKDTNPAELLAELESRL
jgi:AMMECR1 domain-containing protein